MAPSSDSDRVDLAVIGAGLNGSLLALAAGEAGLRTALIDRVPLASLTEAGFDGRTTAIAYTSQRLFKAIGVWDELESRAEPILDIRISDAGHDGRASPLFLHFDHREAAETEGDAAPMGWIVENRFLRAAMLRRLAGLPGVELVAPDEALDTSRSADKVEIALKSGRRLAARLVASAEGRFGTLREDAGIGARAWSYDQIAIVLVAHHERPHRGVAQEKFLPGGPFAILPMQDGRCGRASLVDRLDRTRVDRQAPARARRAALQRRVRAPLRRFPRSRRTGRPALVASARACPCRALCRRAHGAGRRRRARHPSDRGPGLQSRRARHRGAGRGADRAKRLGLDIGAADTLERYARWRRADNFTMVAATDLLNRLFSNDIKPLRLMRDVGLAAVNRVPPLRKFFVRHAMGLGGDLPKLIRGERP